MPSCLTTQAQEAQALLLQLKEQLQSVNLWDEHPPEPSKLKSTAPFAVDQLEFYQWLQFIMIPKFEQLISTQQALPRGFSVSPMAEESWRGKWQVYRKIILTLKALDDLLK